jgi:hypothetical protein
MWGLFLNPQSSNSSPSSPFTGGGPAGTPIAGFDAPQLFSLPPGWANAAGEVASIITSITIANSAVSRLRIALPPSQGRDSRGSPALYNTTMLASMAF